MRLCLRPAGAIESPGRSYKYELWARNIAGQKSANAAAGKLQAAKEELQAMQDEQEKIKRSVSNR